MMKQAKIFLLPVCLFLFLLGAVSQGRADVLPASSKISAVTVYPGAAHVTRQAKVNLLAGAHSVEFKNIIPAFDENSLTVSGAGTAGVKIFGAYVKTVYLKEVADKRVQELQGKIEIFDDQITTLNNSLKVMEKERQYLDSVNLFAGQQIPKDLVTSMPSAERLKEVQSYINTGLTDINTRGEEAARKVRDLTREKDALVSELNSLRGNPHQMQRSIVVDLECVSPGDLTLDVAYLVGGANWEPLYDARTQFALGKVELSAYGVIRQTTGEDWSEVALTLSTAQPMLSGRMPYIAPWTLQAYEPMRQNAMLASGMFARKAAAPAMQYEAFDSAAVGSVQSMEAPTEKKAEMAQAEVAQKGIAVVYKIVRPATVKSDGSETKYPVSAQTLIADFEYSTFPHALPYAYLGSRVKNAEGLQLLGGPVNLFLENDYVGRSSVDNTGPGESFDLYLGVDENVKVERKELARKIDDVLVGGIPAPTIKVTYQYRLTVENYKRQNIKVKLFEAMPVSENDRIKVKVFDVNVQPKVKDWQSRKGVWLWELDLKPAEKQEIFYTFIVEYPRDMKVSGL